jgi:tetratricopeptide (TPR) repeat protein
MATFFENKDRRVIPNWRSFNKTVMLGELDFPYKNIIKEDIPLSIDSYIEDFMKNRTCAYAGDLISAAVVNGFEKHDVVLDAAKFVIANKQYSTKSQISLAERIISRSFTSKKNLFELETFSIEEMESYFNPIHIRRKIHKLKELTKNFLFNPIIWVELSRQYSIIGQEKQAISAMKAALQLAPENRFVLRSAVRLFAHYDDLELSHDIIRKCKLTNIDPWLTSAEISLATLRGRTSRFMKRGSEMVFSRNFTPFSFTELASSLGTVELMNGSKKKSRDFFQNALLSPNDNSLAQVEWASKLDEQLDINPANYKVKHNFEALALDNFNNLKLDDALRNSFHWFLDMPFSKRPAMLGSHICDLLNEKEKSRDFLKAGLISHPNDAQLLNNLGYSFALDNNTEEALTYINKAFNDNSMNISRFLVRFLFSVL